MKNIFISIFLIFSFSGILLANGGGTYPESAALGSSSPVFRDIKDVEIISERLFCKLKNKTTRVEVEYLLWNKSDKDYLDVDYGFPVDFLQNSVHKDSVVSDVQFFANNERLEILNRSKPVSVERANKEWSLIEPKIDRSDSSGPGYPYQGYRELQLGDSESELKSARQWFYTKVSIPSHATLKLTVIYEIENMKWGDGFPPYESYFFEGSNYNNFDYDFSPASHWGNGIVRDFYVEIDFSELTYQYPKTERWENWEQGISAYGLDFEKKEDRYIYQTRNFDLKNAKKLRVNYRIYDISSLDILAEHLIPQNQYVIKGSVDTKNYPISNLSDMNMETVWVSKGVGGEIEIDVSGCKEKVVAVAIIGDYQKNENLFWENNRIAEIQVDLKYKGYDWVKDVGVYGHMEKEYIPTYFGNFLSKAIFFDMGYLEWNLFDEMGYIGKWDLENKPIPALDKMRFRITEVDKGTKYDDTCITEVFLFHE